MNQAVKALKSAKSAAIIMHIRPDGDTIGSSLALKNALEQIGKKAEIFCDDSLPERFGFLKGFETLNSGDFKQCDIAVAVDCSDRSRLGQLWFEFKKKPVTVCIDHHGSNDGFADITVLDANACATAIVMEKIIDGLGVKKDRAIAEGLYTGLSTDTGNFSHANTSAETFAMACRLIECGIDLPNIVTRLYKSDHKERILLLGEAIRHMRFFADDKIAVMTVTKKDVDAFHALSEDTEGFIDHAIGIQGVEIAACIMQYNGGNQYKVSLRSKTASACAVAQVFGGGGHKLASGCMLSGFLEDVVDKIVKAMKDEIGV